MYSQEDRNQILDNAIEQLKRILETWEAVNVSFKELLELASERYDVFLERRELMREQKDIDRRYIDKWRSTRARAYNAHMLDEKARQVMRRRKMIPRHRQ